VLAYLRKGETFADLAAGFGIGTATAWRYVTDGGAAGRPLTQAARGTGAGQARGKPPSQKAANRAHARARLRGLGERANAQLKTWRILRKLRCCPWRAGQLAKAIHVLQAHEMEG